MSEYTPTTEQVEAAAIAFTCETRDEWDASPETYKQMVREDARDALIAAGTVPPQVDETSVAELERAAAEEAYEQGRLDERHDCNRFAEYQQGKITEDQYRRDVRARNPYRETKEEER